MDVVWIVVVGEVIVVSWVIVCLLVEFVWLGVVFVGDLGLFIDREVDVV